MVRVFSYSLFSNTLCVHGLSLVSQARLQQTISPNSQPSSLLFSLPTLHDSIKEHLSASATKPTGRIRKKYSTVSYKLLFYGLHGQHLEA